MEWECVLPVEDILVTDELKRKLPVIHWQASGVLIPYEQADHLEELWSSHLTASAATGLQT
ncbi:hypothetical protein A5705_26035 [Mycobacterium sp. E787]|nr:hypothetical protein A5705_26035 [Mycobacterium sp. E787]